MALNVSLATMRSKARQRSDQENSPFVSDSELTSLINDACKNLYDKLVNAGELYKLATDTITIASNTDTYDLPDDFYKMVGIDGFVGAQSTPITIVPFNFSERNRYVSTVIQNVTGSGFKYVLQGEQIRFLPQPDPGTTVKLWYVPSFVDLESDDDAFDGINGFEEWVILEAAINMMIKEESDPAYLMAQQQKIDKRISQMKINRDMGQSSTISDVNFRDGYEQIFFGGEY